MDLRVCVLVFAIFCSYQTRKSLMVDNISVTHGREIHRGVSFRPLWQWCVQTYTSITSKCVDWNGAESIIQYLWCVYNLSPIIALFVIPWCLIVVVSLPLVLNLLSILPNQWVSACARATPPTSAMLCIVSLGSSRRSRSVGDTFTTEPHYVLCM